MSSTKPEKTIPQKSIVVEELEQRLLFSAEILSASLHGDNLPGSPELEQVDWSALPAKQGNSADMTVAAKKASLSEGDLSELIAESAIHNTDARQLENEDALAEGSTLETIETPALRVEVIFIDAAVEDSKQLLSDVKATRSDQIEWKIVWLDAERDGIKHITESLAGVDNIDAIHIISHGDDQGFQLGNSRLDTTTADNYASELTDWGKSLTQDADLLIYGCDLASSEIGRALINTLADATNSDVAASVNATGHEKLGADWILEYTQGVINTDIAISSQVQHSWYSSLIANDIVDGSTGDDVIDASYIDPADGEMVDNADGTGPAGNEDVIDAGAGNDTITSGDEADIIAGEAGDDIISTGGYSDYLPAYVPTSGASGTVTGTSGNLDVSYTVTSDMTLNAAGAIYSITSDSEQTETHTHTFSQPVTGGQIVVTDLGLNNGTGSAFDLYVDGVGIGSLVSAGNATITYHGNAYYIPLDRIWGTGPADNGATITIDVPFSTLQAIGGHATATDPGDQTNYTVSIDSNPAQAGDIADGGDDSDTILIADDFAYDHYLGGEGGIDNDSIDASVNSTALFVAFDGNESGTILDGHNTASFIEIENFILTTQADFIDASIANTAVSVDGGAGADVIIGSTGDDLITGNTGNDDLTGGAGSDTYILANGFGADTIQDFSIGSDLLDVQTLTDATGNPVDTDDVAISDDGSGNAVLTFPNGESINLVSIATTAVDSAVELNSIGIPSNDPPVVDLDADNSGGSGLSFNTTFTENGGPIPVADSDAFITDVDSAQLASLQAIIVNAPDGSNERLWANPGVTGLTVSFSTATSILTITGPATVAEYQQVLRTITYENLSEDPDSTQRTVNIVVSDSAASSQVAQSYINVVAVNDPPWVANNTGAPTTRGSTVQLSSAMLNEGDPDDSLFELTYSITGTANGHVELVSNPATPVLTFTQADITNGQVHFVHDGLSGADGSFDFTLSDGGEDGVTPAIGNFSVSIVAISDNYSTDEDTPINVDVTSGLLANDRQPDVLLGGNTVLGFDASIDTDGNAQWASNVGTTNLNLSGATYTTLPDNPIPGIDAAFDFSGNSSGATTPALDSFPAIVGTESATLEAWIYIDSLSTNNVIFDTGTSGGPGITLVTSGGQLILAASGNGGVASMSVAAPTAGEWHHIAVSIKMKGGFDDQVRLYVDGSREFLLTVLLSNWGPGDFGLGTSNGSTVGGFTGDLAGQIAHFRVHDEDLGDATISHHAANPGAGTAIPYVESTNTSTTLGAVSVLADGSFNYDPAGQFESLGVGQSTTDTFTYVYNDGLDNTVPVDVTININGVNDVPVTSSIESSVLNYTENNPATTITSTLTVDDIDAAPIQSATVSFSGSYVPTEDVLGYLNQPDISGTYDSGTGTLTLTGASSAASYQTALRSVTYLNNSESPNTLPRTVSFLVNDGIINSNLQTRQISITPVNDPPVQSAIEGVPLNYIENEGPVAVTSSLIINDVDDALIHSASVSISNNFAIGEDVLTFTNQAGITGIYSTSTGILSLSGTATVTDYELALRSITYENNSDDPSTLSRTVSFVVNDGDINSNLLSRDIVFSAVNDLPVLSTIEIEPAFYVENNTPTGITGNLAVFDVDDTNIESATVTITGNFTPDEDVLSFTNSPDISGIYDVATGILNLAGSATLADYETAIHSITYHNANDNPSILDRTVSFVVNDGEGSSNTLSRNITITTVNDPPVLSTIETAPASYTENGSPTGITGNLSVSDVDDTNIESATVSITGNFALGEDVLTFTDQFGITGSYNGVNGELTLTGAATLVNYQAAIQSVTYQNTSDNPSTLDRTVSFVVNDGDLSSNLLSRDIVITPVNDLPVLSTIEAGPAFYTENDSPIGITGNLAIFDVDDTTIESAIISITGNFASGEDVLSFINQSGISGNYDASTGILTLTGSATLAEYETAIHAITYQNANDNPSVLDRSVSFVVNDGDDSSNVLSRNITIFATNDPPELADIEPAPVVYTENGSPIGITSNLGINDIDDVNIESATISITGNFTSGEDILAFTNQPGITGSYNIANGELTFTGSATVADYQAAIHSVTYQNTNDRPSTLERTVSLIVNDGDVSSNILSRNITIIAVNDPPVLSTIETAPAFYTENGPPIGITGNLSVYDVDDTNIESATVAITGNFASGEDVLAYSNQFGITGSYNGVNGELTLTGAANLTDYQAAIQSVTYQNTSDNPSTLDRTVSFVVNDGDLSSNLLSRDIVITPVNDLPVLSTIESGPAFYAENDSPIGITGNLAVFDIDDTNIQSATVSITGNFSSGEDALSFINQSGISGSYDASTGKLTLTGSATLAEYEAAIHSITYQNSNDNPSVLDRSVSFVVNDGDDTSNVLSRNITIIAINDPPELADIETAPIVYTENGSPIGITNNLGITDVDTTNIESATVSISGNFVAGEDILAFTNQLNITGSYDETIGQLTLTGAATPAEYETAIQSIVYHNTSDDPSSLNRTISFLVNDGVDNSNLLSRDIAFTVVNDAPVLSGIEVMPALYTENDTPIGITGNLVISDVDNTNIESASVSITGNLAPEEDMLVFTNQSGITGSYNSANGILSLTGSATLSDYQAALRSVSYYNSSDDPSTIDRSVSFAIDDGNDSSSLLSRNIVITAVNDAPDLSTTEALPVLYTENDVPIGITDSLTVNDVDNSFIQSATVSISSNFATGEDEFLYTNQSGITGNYDAVNGILTLTGSAALSDYQAAIQSVTYQNTSNNPSDLTRTVSLVVNDGLNSSVPLSRSIEIIPVNDPPVAMEIESAFLVYAENDAPVVITNTLSFSDDDDTIIESATVVITTNFSAAEDQLMFTDQSGITGNYSAATGVLALNGSSSIADYQAALQSIRYTNTSDNPTALQRDITFSVNDGDQDSNIQIRTISLTAVNDAPILSSPDTTAAQYTENNPTIISSTIALDDIDNTQLQSATVSIDNYYAASEDSLAFTTQPGINGIFNPVTGVLSLSGSSSIENYETALRSVTYTNNSDDPSTLDRTISYSVNDGGSTSNSLTRDIALTAVNDAPMLSDIEPTAVTFIENEAPVGITNNLSLEDFDDINIESATVSINTNFTYDEDELLYSDQSGITGSYDNNTGLLTLNGSASMNNYQQALRSVTYANHSENPNPQTRQISFTINDGDLNSNALTRDIQIVQINDAPVTAVIESTALQYTENQGSVRVSSTLELSDFDDINFESAIVTISSNYRPGEDQLNYTGSSNITASWDPLSGKLTLTGTDSVESYQAALRSITYENTSHNPDNSTRTLSFSVNDGDTESNIVQRDITIAGLNDAPLQSALESTDLAYTENQGSTPITSTIQLTDLDDQFIESALITIANGYNDDQDRLSFVNTSTITGTWHPDAAELILTGADTITAYQEALQTVHYENIADNPDLSDRTVTLSINDGDTDSNLLSRNINVLPINDPPTITDLETVTLDYLENMGGIDITAGLITDDVDNTTLTSAVVRISNGYNSNEDVLSFANTPNITASWDSVQGILTLNGSDTLAAYQTALRAIQYQNNSDDPTQASRTLDFSVFDGDQRSNSVTRPLSITSINDAPSGTDATLTFLEDTTLTLSRADFGFSDILDNNTFSAVTISQLPGDGTLLLNAIPVNTDQVITISDIDSNLLTYAPESDASGVANDNFGFRVHDDGGNSDDGVSVDQQQRVITFNITNVSDAPSGGDNTVTTPEDTDHVFIADDFRFTDPQDNDSFNSIIITSLPTSGILKLNGAPLNAGSVVEINAINSGVLTYTPPANDTGSGHNGFGFKVQDTGDRSNGGEFTDPTDNFISFDVQDVNDPPRLVTENATVDEGSEIRLTTAVLTAIDADDLLAIELMFSLKSVPMHGILTLNGNVLSPDNTFTLAQLESDQLLYTHDGSESSEDYFDVSVQDGGENGSTPSSGRFSIIVTEVIDPAPELEGDVLNLAFGQSFNSLNGDVLASGYSELSNAQLSSNTLLVVQLEREPAHGTLQFSPDGSFSYTHNGSAALQDSFTYRVTNEDGVFTIAQVDINIEPPLASAFSATTSSTVETITPVEEQVAAEEITVIQTELAYVSPEIPSSTSRIERTDTNVEEVINNTNISPVVSTIVLSTLLDELDVKKHIKAKNYALYNENVTLTNMMFDVLLEVETQPLREITSNSHFLEGLSRFENDLQQSEEQISRKYRLGIDTGIGISLGASAGVVAWALRGGALFASVMASTPLWSSIDPTSLAKERKNEQDISAEDTEVEEYFSD